LAGTKKIGEEDLEKKLTYLELLKQIDSGRVENAYHFTGEEDFLKEEAWKKIVSLLVPESLRSFNLDFLYGAETSVDQIYSKVSTAPVNAKKRVVVLFDLHKLSDFPKEMLLKFLPKLPNSTCLILLSPKLDVRAKKAKFYTALEKLTTTVEFTGLWDNQIPSWVINRVIEKGKKIEGNAARILQDLVGNNLSDLASEIDKLVIYVGEKDTITSADVESVAGLSRTHTVFQLIDSIGERDCKNSLQILTNLILAGENPGGIIFWLTHHLEMLIQTKEFTSSSTESLASYIKTKPFLASKYQKQAQNFNLQELEKGLIFLYQTDVDLKSNLMPDKLLMELLVYNLCHL
jgi:DNA polymerase-3 subunit delta